MNDSYSNVRISLLHPNVRDIFRKFIDDCETELKIQLRITQGLRTFAEQTALYAQGRTLPGKIVTYAPAGESYHNYGLAIDVVPIAGGIPQWTFDFKKLLGFMPEGMVAGETFVHADNDHFEFTFGMNWSYLLTKYKAGDITDGYVNLTPAA